MKEIDWNDVAKRLLKAELVRRGISNEELANLLETIGVDETKIGIDSKISRGTFSAAFLLQCLNAIGCKNISAEVFDFSAVDEPRIFYKSKKFNKKRARG